MKLSSIVFRIAWTCNILPHSEGLWQLPSPIPTVLEVIQNTQHYWCHKIQDSLFVCLTVNHTLLFLITYIYIQKKLISNYIHTNFIQFCLESFYWYMLVSYLYGLTRFLYFGCNSSRKCSVIFEILLAFENSILNCKFVQLIIV